MRTLKENEMNRVNGGISWGALGIIGGAIVLIVGIFDGFTNPIKCNNR